MARPKKKNSNPGVSMEQLLKRATELFVEPYDDRDGRDEDLPSLRSVAYELGTTLLRTRKLLITAECFSTETSRMVQHLVRQGKNIDEIMTITGLGKASVYSYIPYKHLAFNLDETTVNADRHKLFRRRVKAVETLQDHKGLPDASEYLWLAIIAFEDYPFTTTDRGKKHTGATKFRYTVSRQGEAGGRHFYGVSIPGCGNELYINEKEKSISRWTVELALKNAIAEQKQNGCVSGPRKLGVPGARSALYALFLRFGLITQEQE